MAKERKMQEMLDDMSPSDHIPYEDRCHKDENTGRVSCVAKELVGRGNSRHVEEAGVVFDLIDGRPQLISEFGSQRVKDRMLRRVQKRLR